MKRSGDERRFVRHQSSISRICPSASGVVLTGSVTGGGAAHRESPTRAAGATLFFAEIVTFIVRDEVDDRTVRQSRRLVENGASVLDACSEGANGPTVRSSTLRRKVLHSLTKRVELLQP